MSWINLPTNFINLVWSGLKKYRQYNNPDNTVSFEDVTDYEETEGTQMSAAQLNQMTGAINKLMTNIAADFSTSTPYAVGDYCMYEDQLYRFTTAHPAGSWNSGHVTAVSLITDELRADNTPTNSSSNLVRSGGVYSALGGKLSDAPSDDKTYGRKNGAWFEVAGGGGSWGSITGTLSDQTDLQSALNAKQDTLTFDANPTAGSTNPVTSGGIKTALDAKQDSLTFDSTPTAGSTNPVTSGGIKTALDGKVNNSLIADDFSTSAAYAAGDYCIYEGALYRFTSAHPAGAWNSSDVVQVVVADELVSLLALIESRMTFKISGTVSASNYTLTDARINSEHWEVDQIYFATPSNVTSQVHWTTDITNHQVSLSATYAGSTSVVVKMHWVQ